MATISRIRLALDGTQNAAVDIRTGTTPFIWRGADVQFELGIFDGSTLVAVSNIDSITLQARSASDKRGPVLMSKTIARADLNAMLTQPAWDAGTDAHAVVPFSSGETAIDLDNTAEGACWFGAAAITTDSPPKTIFLGATILMVEEDGVYAGDDAPVGDPLYLTAAQSDARYQMAWQIEDILADVADAIATANAAAAAAGAAQTAATTALSTANAAQTTANAAIPLAQKGAANGVATLGVDGIVPLDELPPVATPEHDGLMSASQAALLLGLSQSAAASSIGFNDTVRCLLVADGMIYAGGDFTRYGGTDCQYACRLTFAGAVDSGWSAGVPAAGEFLPDTGASHPIRYIARASDGDILLAHGLYSLKWYSIVGGSGVESRVLKITPDGKMDTPPVDIGGGNTASSYFRIDTTGTISGLAVADSGLVAIIKSDGFIVADPAQKTILGSVHQTWLYGLVTALKTCVNNAAVAAAGGTLIYLSGGTDHVFDGTLNPIGVKLIDAAADPLIGAGAGHIVTDWISLAGTGAEVPCYGMAVGHGYGTDYVIVANRPNSTNKWNDGSSGVFGGLYKLKSDGTAATGFDVDLAFDEDDATPNAIPFAIDSLGRIYLGGPVTSINGTDVTPWMIYRLTAAGALDRVYDQFTGGQVLCMALRGDDVLCAGGSFTAYQGKPAGRISFINAETGGPADPSVGLILGADEGIIKTSSTPLALPKYANYLWRKPGSPPALYICDDVSMTWVSTCEICALPQTLPLVTFDPPSGTAIDTGIDVTLACPGHTGAVIHYTTDGTSPTSASPIYTAPITIDSPTTLRAVAVQSGWNDSLEAIAQYDSASLPVLDAPTLSPASGSAVPLTCTITHAESGVSIYYTLDGTPPSTASTLYSGGISVTVNTTIKAIATKSGWATSGISQATYSAADACPTVQYYAGPSPISGGRFSWQWNTPNTSGMVARWTTNGVDPTPSTPATATYALSGEFLPGPMMRATFTTALSESTYVSSAATGFFTSGYTGAYYRYDVRVANTAPGRSMSPIFRSVRYLRADNYQILIPS